MKLNKMKKDLWNEHFQSSMIEKESIHYNTQLNK